MKFKVVRINDQTPAMQLTLQGCAGLLNRESAEVYTIIRDDRDFMWLRELRLPAHNRVEAKDILSLCLEKFCKCVVYSRCSQQALIPNILTLAAVSDAIPLDEADLKSLSLPSSVEIIDARSVFRRHDTPVSATQLMYENFVGRTTALAMLNPGYQTWNCWTPWNPPLSRPMDSSLVDLVFKERLFALFLVNSGIPCTAAHCLMNRIAESNPWPAPLRVYGYADHWHVFGGFLFEAHTRLTTSYNMGAIPTAGTANLSFFSSMRPELRPGELKQNPPEEVAYDPSRTYVAFVVGDGDNVAYMMDRRAEWMRKRVEGCAELRRRGSAVAASPPPSLTWTISPHLARLAPAALEWYYDRGRETGSDYFMLPPSGHLYAYPASMPSGAQDGFVAATERDARLLGTSSTVNWEWFTSWWTAEGDFLPKYGRGGTIRGVFASNVPFLFPTFTWMGGQFFKVLRKEGSTNSVILFRPREWRGVDDRGRRSYYQLSPEEMVEELASYPRGTVAYVYMSSDEGLRLDNSFMKLHRLLPEHVRLVSADAAATLARDSSRFL